MVNWVILGLTHTPDEANNERLEELNQLLNSLGVKFETKESDNFPLLAITYDPEKIRKKLSRGAGAKPKFMDRTVLVDDIKHRMENETADEIAKSLGVSRSTLFRKLKHAEEAGFDYIF